jgi:tetratricopeptide (TPR) repeat protein
LNYSLILLPDATALKGMVCILLFRLIDKERLNSDLMKRILFAILTGLFFAMLMQSEGYPEKRPNAGFKLRVASYREMHKAEKHLRSLKERGRNAFVERVDIKNKGVWYRVNIGGFKDKTAAARTGELLKKQGIVTGYAVQPWSGREQESATKMKSKAGDPENIDAQAVQAKGPERERKRAPAAVKKTVVQKTAAKGKHGPRPPAAPSVPARRLPERPAGIAVPAIAPPKKPAVPEPGGSRAAVPAGQNDARSPERKAAKARAANASAQTSPAAQPSAPAINKAFPKSALFESAKLDFNAARYREALPKYLEVSREKLDDSVREIVIRRIADCYFHIGSSGSNRDLLSAVDFYKEALRQYPSVSDDNAEALYRLGKSYVQLKFFYEAKREFQKLYSQYRNSPYFPEALFMMGEMSYLTRNFIEAAARFREYLTEFPQGEYVQRAYFGTADSFSQLQQNDQAGLWYAAAQRRWTPADIPGEALLKLGQHYFRGRRYPEALRAFFYFINTYPDDDTCRDVLFSIARSLMELEQNAIALKMYSLLIERFPDSREAQESAIIVANIGVKQPGLKLPDLPGIAHYRDPLKLYNEMLVQTSGSGEMTEGLLFQKGYALWKYGRHDEAFGAFSTMLRRFPRGRYKEEGIKNLFLNVNQLVRKYGAERDCLAIAHLYYRLPDNLLNRYEDFETVYAIGDAMRKIGLFYDAKRVFDGLLGRNPPASDKSRILVAMADIENSLGRPDEAERILRDIPDKDSSDRKPAPGLQTLRGEIFFRKGLYDKAAAAYAQALASGDEPDNAAVVYRNYAEALKETNACASAVANYEKAIVFYNRGLKEKRFYPKDIPISAYQGIGDCYYREGKYKEAVAMYKQSAAGTENRENLWALYDMGRGYAKADNKAMVDKTLDDLRIRGGEGFWASVSDYVVRESAWREKYARYLR